MPNPAFFARLGLFIREEFLDQATCERLCAEASPAASSFGGLSNEVGKEQLDLARRKVYEAQVSAETRAFLKQQVLTLLPELRGHFQLSLEDCQDLRVLVYQPGHFYVPHSDGPILGRKVSVVVFLNSPGADGGDGGFHGGDLTFYGSLRGSDLSNLGLPMRPARGLLVAFSSETVHEVTKIICGERVAVACWLS